MSKIIITKEELYNLYWINGKSAKEISEIYNVSDTHIRRIMTKYNIPKRSHSDIIKNKIADNMSDEDFALFLTEQYVEKRKTIKEISDEFKINSITLSKYMDKFGIKRRNVNYDREKYTKNGMTDEEFFLYLQNEYKTKSINKIASELNVTSSTVRKYLKKYNIPLLNHKEANKKYNSGKNNHKYIDGKRLLKSGYISLTVNDYKYKRNGNRIYEHIYVMENYLGRKLNKNEIVHHINGNKSDNRIENLQLMTKSEHILLHKNNGSLTKSIDEIKKEGGFNG